ncbi:unnamed protein product [Absidia cylindrospora]
MKQMVLMPEVSYFSYFAERRAKASHRQSLRNPMNVKKKNSNYHTLFNDTKAGCDTIHKTAQHRLPQKSTTLDSGITTRHLLADETDDEYDNGDERRRASCFTLATLGSEGVSPWTTEGHSRMDGDDKKETMVMPPLPIDASIKLPWAVSTPSPTKNGSQTPSRKPSSYFTGIFTSPAAVTSSFSNLNTPDSDIRTIVGSPTTMDDDIIMMRDL